MLTFRPSAIVGPDLDLRMSADLHPDLRAGEAPLLRDDRLSPLLGDAGVDEDLVILFSRGGVLVVEVPEAKGDDPPADADLRSGEPHRVLPFQKGAPECADGLCRFRIKGNRRLAARRPQDAGLLLVELFLVPEGQDFVS